VSDEYVSHLLPRQLQSSTAGASVGASEGASIGRQLSSFNQRTKHAFAPCSIEAEETRGLGKRQRQSRHLTEFC
jgi:hypothetical protein